VKRAEGGGVGSGEMEKVKVNYINIRRERGKDILS